jgi:hypothetical protein
MSSRRLRSPWSVDEQDVFFVVPERGGQALAYVYFEEEPRRRSAAKLLTKDGASWIAANIAKLLSYLQWPACNGPNNSTSPR